MCVYVFYAFLCVDGGCICVSACVSECWIMTGVPASSQIHAQRRLFLTLAQSLLSALTAYVGCNERKIE